MRGSSEKETPSFSQNHVYSTLSDNNKIVLSLEIIEKIYKQAESSKKTPYFILGIKRNDNEIFVLEGNLKLERRNN